MLSYEQALAIFRQIEDYNRVAADKYKSKEHKKDKSTNQNNTKYTQQGKRFLRHSRITGFISRHFEIHEDGRVKLKFSLEDIAREMPDVDNGILGSDIKQVLIGFEKGVGTLIRYDPKGYNPKNYNPRHIYPTR